MNEETSLMWQIACFCVCGALLGVLYEPLRILRLIIPHHSFITGVEDTVYLALCGVVLFGLSMETGNGNFRLSYLLAAFVGGVVYFLTVGRLIKDYLFCHDKDRFQGSEINRKKTAAACHKVLCVNCT